MDDNKIGDLRIYYEIYADNSEKYYVQRYSYFGYAGYMTKVWESVGEFNTKEEAIALRDSLSVVETGYIL